MCVNNIGQNCYIPNYMNTMPPNFQNQAAINPYYLQNQYQQQTFYPSLYYTNNFAPSQTSIIPPDIQTKSADGAWELKEVNKTPYGDNLYRYELKNGQTVVLMPKKNATTIIKTFVDAGSMNENDENRGISHFNEHNVFNGSKNLESGRFFKEVGKLGADTNASTDYAQTDFYIMSPIVDDKSLKQIIEMHADMLVNPLFPSDMVEKEKANI